MADQTVSKICIELGSVACQRGDYALTYTLYNKGLAESSTEDDLALAGTLKKIGQSYAARSKYRDAAKFLKKAMTVYKAMSAVNQAELTDVFDQLAELSQKQGNYSRAIRYYQRAMEIEENLEEKDKEKSEGRLNQIAWLQLRQGNLVEARSAHSKLSKAQTVQVRTH